MEITNLSTNTIVCTIDNMRVHIQPGCDFQCSDTFETISFAPGQGSYSIIQAENAKILKLLSFFWWSIQADQRISFVCLFAFYKGKDL